MTKPTLNATAFRTPLTFQDFPSYLPTAYDDSFTLTKRINAIIRHLHQIGELSNGLIEKWNEVMDWIINEGLENSVEDKLQEWLEDGTLDKIINEKLFGDLIVSIKLKQDIDTLPFVDVKQLKIRENLTYTAAMQKALNLAETRKGVVLIIPNGERVVLTEELKVFANTTIQAGKNTEFVREHNGYMMMNGNRSTEINPTTAGAYEGRGNIEIVGGIWNGNGIRFPSKASIFHFGHGDGFNLDGVTLKDVANSHHIEFNACRNIDVTNCRFLGWVGTSDTFNEAIQLDVAYPGSTTIGKDDGYGCENVNIDNCYFGDSATHKIARGIGAHNSIIGRSQKNINITDCVFEGLLNYGIRCYNFERVNIDNNKFIRCGSGINIRAAITGLDTINSNGTQVGAEENQHINITNNHFDDWANAGRMIEVYGEKDTAGRIRNVDIIGNTIDMTSAGATHDAILVHFAEHVNVTNNSIKNAKGNAIYVRLSNFVSVNDNNISDIGEEGVSIEDSTHAHVNDNIIIRMQRNGVYVNNCEMFTVNDNIISGVNAITHDDDFNHVRVVTSSRLGKIIDNIFRNYSGGFTTPRCIYVTNTCVNVFARDNVGIGYDASISATNNAADANGNVF